VHGVCAVADAAPSFTAGVGHGHENSDPCAALRVPLRFWHECQDSTDLSWQPSLNPLADDVENDRDEDDVDAAFVIPLLFRWEFPNNTSHYCIMLAVGLRELLAMRMRGTAPPAGPKSRPAVNSSHTSLKHRSCSAQCHAIVHWLVVIQLYMDSLRFSLPKLK